MYKLISFLWVSYLYTTMGFIFSKKNVPSHNVVSVTWSDGELDWGFEDFTHTVTSPPSKKVVYRPIISFESIFSELKENFLDKVTIYDNINDIIEQNIEYFQYISFLLIPSTLILLIFERNEFSTNKENIKKIIFAFIIIYLKSPKSCF